MPPEKEGGDCWSSLPRLLGDPRVETRVYTEINKDLSCDVGGGGALERLEESYIAG